MAIILKDPGSLEWDAKQVNPYDAALVAAAGIEKSVLGVQNRFNAQKTLNIAQEQDARNYEMKVAEFDAANKYRTDMMNNAAAEKIASRDYMAETRRLNQEMGLAKLKADGNKVTLAELKAEEIQTNKNTVAAVTKYATMYKGDPDGAIAKITELRATGIAANAAIAAGLEKEYNKNATTTKTNKVDEVTHIIEDLDNNNPTIKNKAITDAKKLGIEPKAAATIEELARVETAFATAYPESSNKNWLGDIVGLKPTAQETIDAMRDTAGLVGVDLKEEKAIYKKFMIERFNRATKNARTEAELENIRKEKEIYLFNFNKGTTKDAASMYRKNETRKTTNLVY